MARIQTRPPSGDDEYKIDNFKTPTNMSLTNWTTAISPRVSKQQILSEVNGKKYENWSTIANV